MTRLNYKIIIYIMGLLLLFNGGFMFLSAAVSAIYREPEGIDILMAGVVAIILGAISMYLTRKHQRVLHKKEGYLIVSLGWLIMAFAGTMPYVFSGALDNYTDAFFETMSGFTTTGASIMNDIEIMPKGVLFWRSLTHWIGGMGIIVLAVAILPLLGIGGMQLFAAEAPGPSADKLHPRITDTAKRLWLIYVGFTGIETILLRIAGMNWFDAINHALSTLSTGGFSTKNASMAYWNDNPAVQWIIIVFMFIAGTNFVLSYFAFKGRFSRILKDTEFKWYAGFVLLFTLISAVLIYYQADLTASTISHPLVAGRAEGSLRHAVFQVLAVMTTTGFVTADYTLWTPFLTIMFFGLFFLGGSAGSTSGGVKVVRHIILIRNGIMEFKRTLHPSAIIPVRYNGRAVPSNNVFSVLGFFILYMLSFIIGAVVLAALGLDFDTAIGGALSSLGNVGPAFGDLSPVDNFAGLPDLGKWWCSFLMLIGRLELFTVLILFTPFFWRNR
ncbi:MULTISPECIES: TrkH family potassium uptake protein [Nonlabens]|uniref:TrkH family potassium uptake protein n=1 Tax=Nonlabens TaxID=363408 RepID=UPI000CF3CF75|nr:MULTISPECIES: potassium transporter TrkG [Nonlabens]MEE2801051.1 potassium transporter TrkG [Bacteroidota bacterium]PQJ19127.1 potassium transporter [Nonlabens tegetincola]